VGQKKLVRKAEPLSERGMAWPRWTGFRNKTVWDFLQLLIVPLMLAKLLRACTDRDAIHLPSSVLLHRECLPIPILLLIASSQRNLLDLSRSALDRCERLRPPSRWTCW
jgi:hypothetical protein